MQKSKVSGMFMHSLSVKMYVVSLHMRANGYGNEICMVKESAKPTFARCS